MDCDHLRCCYVVVGNFTNCLACVVEHLRNDDEPLCYKNQILDQLLNDIDFSTPSHIAVFQVADDLLTDVVDSILRIYFKLCDFSLQTLVAQVILKLWQHFSDDVVEVITAFISSVCCTNHRNHIHLLSLLVDLLPTLTMLQDKLLFSDSFIAYIISGLSFPDDELRKVLLEISECLVSRCVSSSQPLHVFNHLPSCIINLMFSSILQPIMISSLHIINESAKSDYFVEWVIDDFASNSEDQSTIQGDKAFEHGASIRSGINKLLAAMKRIFLLHEDALNLPAVEAIRSLLKHGTLLRPLLDADLAEIMYDSLSGSTNEQMIMAVYECVLHLAEHEEFFLSCHAAYGVKPVCHSLQLLLRDESHQLACVGFRVLQALCDRQPSDVSLLPTITLFDQFLQVVSDGLACKNIAVVCLAVATSCSLLKHLPHPLPCKDLASLFTSMEQYLPNHFAQFVTRSSSQCINEELLDCAQEVISHLFEFVGKCLSLCGCSRNSQPLRNSGDLVELLLLSVSKQWLPYMKERTWILCSPSSMKNCLLCVTNALELGSSISENLWEYFLNEGYIEHVLLMKVQFQNNPNFRHFVDVMNESLCKLSLPLLHIFDCVDCYPLMQSGISIIGGNAEEMLNYLKEPILSSTGQIDNMTLNMQCAVLMLLALTNWQRNRLSAFNNIQTYLDLHTQLNSEVKGLPMILAILKFFLYSVCQQESTSPNFPVEVMEIVAKEDNYVIIHPAVLSTTLRCSPQIITNEMKKKIIHYWLDEIDMADFASHKDSNHLVQLVLTDQQVGIAVLDTLLSAPESSIYDKLMIIMTSAVSKIMNDPSLNQTSLVLKNTLVQRLPEILHLDWEKVVQTPVSVTLSQLKLLETLVEKDLLSNDAVLYRPRILRKMILLLTNGLSASSSERLCDNVVTSLLDCVELLLHRDNESRSMNAELSMVFQNAEFLKLLDLLLSQPIKNFPVASVHQSVFKLLSILVRSARNCNIQVVHTIRYQAKKLLGFLVGNYDQNLQKSVILLWTSLFQVQFASQLFKLYPITDGGKTFFTRKELSLAPLDDKFISKLFFFVLNCSAKGFSGIRVVSLQCIYAIVTFVREGDIDCFCKITSSPWLQFTLNPNQCENNAEKEICLSVKSVAYNQ